ncbi:hypothetical protein Tco_0448464 [Tanacetum coccineum]
MVVWAYGLLSTVTVHSDCEGVGEGEDVILEGEVEGAGTANIVGNKATSWPENPLFSRPLLIAKILIYMKEVTKGFSGHEVALIPTMLAVPRHHQFTFTDITYSLPLHLHHLFSGSDARAQIKIGKARKNKDRTTGAKRKKSFLEKAQEETKDGGGDAVKEEPKRTFRHHTREDVFRGDGSSKNYKVLSEMLEDFDRQDVEELYRLVKKKYSASRLEGFDLMLWGDLYVLFESDEEDEIWKSQHEYNLISWRLYGNIFEPRDGFPRCCRRNLEVVLEEFTGIELLRFFKISSGKE